MQNAKKQRDKKNVLEPLPKLISLHEKRALITGSASGIGKAIAYRYAEAGADLELLDVNLDKLEATKNELARFGTEINTHEVDLSKKSEIDAFWLRLGQRTPDVLVNNAGIYPARSFLDVDEAFLKKVMDVNLNSVFWMCQHMIRNRLKKGGIIINIGSIEAIMPLKEGMTHYDITKAGIMILSRTLASEYGRHGFRINVLVPGGVWTPGTKNIAKKAMKLKLGVVKAGIEYNIRNPLGRLANPDEIARMALVLATDLSSYVHGTLIAVDGGFLSA
jgi:NAD(P)-dependent dehydrogenase (short-subunit alcohol dehydrogenase family)